MRDALSGKISQLLFRYAHQREFSRREESRNNDGHASVETTSGNFSCTFSMGIETVALRQQSFSADASMLPPMNIRLE